MDIAFVNILGHLIEDFDSGVGGGYDPEVLQSSVSFRLSSN